MKVQHRFFGTAMLAALGMFWITQPPCVSADEMGVKAESETGSTMKSGAPGVPSESSGASATTESSNAGTQNTQKTMKKESQRVEQQSSGATQTTKGLTTSGEGAVAGPAGEAKAKSSSNTTTTEGTANPNAGGTLKSEAGAESETTR